MRNIRVYQKIMRQRVRCQKKQVSLKLSSTMHLKNIIKILKIGDISICCMLYKIYVKYFISLCPPSELRLQNCFIAFLFGRLWSDFRLLPPSFPFSDKCLVSFYMHLYSYFICIYKVHNAQIFMGMLKSKKKQIPAIASCELLTLKVCAIKAYC